MKKISAPVLVTMAKPKGFDTLRVAGLLDDNETVAVATTRPGAEEGVEELSFTLTEAVHLAEQCLAGHERALTTPGLARILSATVAILFRVSLAGGTIQQKDAGGHGHSPDRADAAADEDTDR